MKRYFILGLVFVAALFLAGCLNSQPKEEGLTCNPPYIKVGLDCCLDQNYNNICDKDEVKQDIPKTQKYEISEALDFCLKEYVYGKEDNWVDLAETHCEALLPEGCLFGYGKNSYGFYEDYHDYEGRSYTFTGKFGVYCPAEFSEELENCIDKIDYSLYKGKAVEGTDAYYIDNVYLSCWEVIPDTCMQVNIVELPYANMYYCKID